MALSRWTFVSLVGAACAITLRSPSPSGRSGEAAVKGNASLHAPRTGQAPCQCEANGATWHGPARSAPKCIFIDLGAADGNTFNDFIANKYGPVSNCPSGGEWEAYLVEANPEFTPKLLSLQAAYPGKVHAMGSTAAYTCAASVTFNIDTDVAHNRWGSSMKTSFAGGKSVTVPTTNVIKLLAESVIPDDWVMLKVDIEGAEYDLIPCLSNFANATLVDRMYLEEHRHVKGAQAKSVYSPQQYATAKQKLTSLGVSIPDYFSQTF
eukprot:CAMPEP_0117504212 /NCGR_PEP_ID=MMETSP0784-20121206/24733_1 /TAXON_ID=39447 /ORGANISM="" /LENGTH=264 /DNA_ID=CAMNT_0005299561 /DNA_START=34 /DNA_END=828 /DNA_ORIENTATION=-